MLLLNAFITLMLSSQLVFRCYKFEVRSANSPFFLYFFDRYLVTFMCILHVHCWIRIITKASYNIQFKFIAQGKNLIRISPTYIYTLIIQSYKFIISSRFGLFYHQSLFLDMLLLSFFLSINIGFHAFISMEFTIKMEVQYTCII